MSDDIEDLRKSLPERFPLRTYCELTRRSPSSAYQDLHRIPGLGLKVGTRTFFDRDKTLALMAQPPVPWVPLKDRGQSRAGRRRRHREARA